MPLYNIHFSHRNEFQGIRKHTREVEMSGSPWFCLTKSLILVVCVFNCKRVLSIHDALVNQSGAQIDKELQPPPQFNFAPRPLLLNPSLFLGTTRLQQLTLRLTARQQYHVSSVAQPRGGVPGSCSTPPPHVKCSKCSRKISYFKTFKNIWNPQHLKFFTNCEVYLSSETCLRL